MRASLPFAAGVVGLSLVASCSSEPAIGEPGTLDVAYRFEGVELPDRVNLYLIDTSEAADCDSAEAHPSEIASYSKRNLPFFAESVLFEDLPADSEWVLVAVGIADASEVAFGCLDGLSVAADRTEYTELILANEPTDVAATYTSSLQIDVGLASAIGAALSDEVFDDIVSRVCALLANCAKDPADATGPVGVPVPIEAEPEPDVRQIVSDLLLELSDLDVGAQWTFTQSGDLIRGEMAWTTIEGIPVGPEWTIVSGHLEGEIPGTTGVILHSRDLAVDTEQLLLFLLQNVLEQDVAEVSPAGRWALPEVRFVDGMAVAVDSDFDRDADRLHGGFYATMTFESVGLVNDFSFEWVAHRVEPPPASPQ